MPERLHGTLLEIGTAKGARQQRSEGAFLRGKCGCRGGGGGGDWPAYIAGAAGCSAWAMAGVELQCGAPFAVEFLHPVTAGRPALTVINLTADMAMLTAVGNDVGFGHVFVRQLIAQAQSRRWAGRVLDQRQFRESAGRIRQGEGDSA